jgi:hypothetical protein
MAYTKTNWKDGDVISAERMNKIEKGIEDAGSSGSGEFIVTFTYTTYTNSWKCDSNNTDIYNAHLSGMDIKYYVIGDGDYQPLNAYGRMRNVSNTYCETELFSFMDSGSFPYIYYYIALSEDEIIPHMIDAPSFFIYALKNGSSYSLLSDSSQYLLDRIRNNYGTGNMTEFSSVSLCFYENNTQYIYTPIGANDTTIYYSGISPDGNIEDNIYTKQVFKLTYDSKTETFTLTKMSENS